MARIFSLSKIRGISSNKTDHSKQGQCMKHFLNVIEKFSVFTSYNEMNHTDTMLYVARYLLKRGRRCQQCGRKWLLQVTILPGILFVQLTYAAWQLLDICNSIIDNTES